MKYFHKHRFLVKVYRIGYSNKRNTHKTILINSLPISYMCRMHSDCLLLPLIFLHSHNLPCPFPASLFPRFITLALFCDPCSLTRDVSVITRLGLFVESGECHGTVWNLVFIQRVLIIEWAVICYQFKCRF